MLVDDVTVFDILAQAVREVHHRRVWHLHTDKGSASEQVVGPTRALVSHALVDRGFDHLRHRVSCLQRWRQHGSVIREDAYARRSVKTVAKVSDSLH